MLIVQAIVSRKTPADGRLEIPESLADRLRALGMPLTISVAGEEHGLDVEEMPCTCSKSSTGQHVHHFLSSEVLRSLRPDTAVSLSVDLDDGHLRVETEA